MGSVILRCVAPDGAYVNECRCDSVEEAWERNGSMGSRWIFYPIPVITGPTNSERARIKAVPDELSAYIGKSLKTLCLAIAACEKEVCDWVNGESACPL